MQIELCNLSVVRVRKKKQSRKRESNAADSKQNIAHDWTYIQASKMNWRSKLKVGNASRSDGLMARLTLHTLSPVLLIYCLVLGMTKCMTHKKQHGSYENQQFQKETNLLNRRKNVMAFLDKQLT